MQIALQYDVWVYGKNGGADGNRTHVRRPTTKMLTGLIAFLGQQNLYCIWKGRMTNFGLANHLDNFLNPHCSRTMQVEPI